MASTEENVSYERICEVNDEEDLATAIEKTISKEIHLLLLTEQLKKLKREEFLENQSFGSSNNSSKCIEQVSELETTKTPLDLTQPQISPKKLFGIFPYRVQNIKTQTDLSETKQKESSNDQKSFSWWKLVLMIAVLSCALRVFSSPDRTNHLFAIHLAEMHGHHQFARAVRGYSVSQMFDLRDLRERSMRALISQITLHNVWMVLFLAEVYHDSALEEVCVNVFQKHLNMTLKSKQWHELVHANLTSVINHMKRYDAAADIFEF